MGDTEHSVGRRDFLRLALAGAVGVAVPASVLVRLARSVRASDGTSPFAMVSGRPETGGFTGDEPSRGHRLLWEKQKYLAERGGIPGPTETASVVIVGGGISGLAATMRLADFRPILLEQSQRFGGNAKGERWADLEYGVGSAYFARPEAGSALGELLDELGLAGRLRHENPAEEEHSIVGAEGGFAVAPFWKGMTDPARAAEFTRVRDALLKVYEDDYPAIPAASAGRREALRALDRRSFEEWVTDNLGTVHPHVEELFHQYCWDALGADFSEVSAAQALNFLSADLAGIAAFPGGNATLSEALCRKLRSRLPAGHLRAGSFVVDVATEKDGVRVTYETGSGELRSIRAGACIVTAPKFVASRIVSGMPGAQVEAISKLKYRAFVVGNLLIKRRAPGPCYAMFHLRGRNARGDAKSRAYTTVIFGGWAAGDRPSRSVLTLYKPFPYDSARKELYAPGAYSGVRASFEAEIPGLLRALNVDARDAAGLRLTRMAHAVPLAARGLLADGTLEAASRTVGGRVFLAQQDNWGNPCVETAVSEGIRAAAEARRLLG